MHGEWFELTYFAILDLAPRVVLIHLNLRCVVLSDRGSESEQTITASVLLSRASLETYFDASRQDEVVVKVKTSFQLRLAIVNIACLWNEIKILILGRILVARGGRIRVGIAPA